MPLFDEFGIFNKQTVGY